MEKYDFTEITDLAAYAGKLLLASGADIVRVEDTVRHIMHSYGEDDFEVFTLTNGIFLSSRGKVISLGEEIKGADGVRDYLRVHNVHLYSTDLGKIDRINTLSRRLEGASVPPKEAYKELERIEQAPHRSAPLRMLASATASGAICYMFGGSLTDSLASFAVGFIYYILAIVLDETKLSRLLTNIICGFAIAVLAYGLCFCGVAADVDRVIIGAIMPLVPGVSFTNSVRDLASGDYISGIVRMTDALIVAVGIAVGVGSVVGLLGLLLPRGII